MAQRDLVVIGGSAGSVGPLRTILSSLPPDFPAAIVIVLHVPSDSTGIFNTVAAASASLPVHAAKDGMKIERGHIYLGIPNYHLIVQDGILRLGSGPRENLVRPSIDPLFRSAAASRGSCAIGVILSGMMNDGADGLRAIKRCAGIALVQSPHDSAASDMPLAALEATSVDLSTEAENLGSAIMRHVNQEAEPARQVERDILVEIEIALGSRYNSQVAAEISQPVPLTCPDCGGVLSQVNAARPLRFRCQVGHSYTSKTLLHEKEGSVDEAVRVALRIVEERAELVSRMGKDAAEAGRTGMAEMYDGRAAEYRRYAETLRAAVLKTIAEDSALGEERLAHTQIIGPLPEEE